MKIRKYVFLGPVIILIIWQILISFQVINSLFLPSPIQVFVTLIKELLSFSIWIDIYYTLFRAISALVLGFIVAVPMGLLLGYFNKFYDSLEFLIEFFRAIPATALFPLFMFFLGIGNLSKIILTFWATSFIIIIYSIYGVRYGKKTRLNVAKVMKIKGFKLFQKFIFPEALPYILTGTRIALSNALIIVVVTEMFIGTNVGIGHRIINNQLVYKIPEMYAAIFLMGIIGYLLNKIFIKYEKIIVHWS